MIGTLLLSTFIIHHFLSVIDASTAAYMDAYRYLPCTIVNEVIECWGYSSASGLLVTPTAINQAPFGDAKPIQIEDGHYSQIILLDDGKVYSIGRAGQGVLGVFTTHGEHATPVPVMLYNDLSGMPPSHLSNVVDIEAGFDTVCAIHSDRSMTCWGENTYGQSSSITEYDGTADNKKVKHVAMGKYETCVVSMENHLTCFGSKLKNIIDYIPPNPILTIEMASSDHGCMILDQSSDNVLCFGKNEHGQLGIGHKTDVLTPPFVSPIGLGHAKFIGAGPGYSCAVLHNDTGPQMCWGLDDNRNLGIEISGTKSIPTSVVTTSDIDIGEASIIGIHCSLYATFLHLSDNRVYSWGSNNYGGLGIGSSNTEITLTGTSSAVCTGILGSQSQYFYKSSRTTTCTPTFHWTDWNITLKDFMSIDKPTTEEGIYNLRSSYTLDDRSYDIELFMNDCETSPTGIDSFPLIFKDATETFLPSGKQFTAEVEWNYNQTKIEMSNIWNTDNSMSGYSEFCVRVNNFMKENNNHFARKVRYVNTIYRIEVDSVNNTIGIHHLDSVYGGTDFINFDEVIEVFQCNEDYSMLSAPHTITEGESLQLCVKTVADSMFGIHSIKELYVTQLDGTPNSFSYVTDDTDSPLAASECKNDMKNTTDAVCKTRIQLLSSYFDIDDPAALFASGTVKLDYVGGGGSNSCRQLSVNNDLHSHNTRVLSEENEPPFGIEISLSSSSSTKEESDTSILSTGNLLCGIMAFLTLGISLVY